MIKVGIVGYGNLGKGVQLAISKTTDMELVGVFTRRNPSDVKPVLPTAVYNVEELCKFKDEIDVLMLCGGSATDLPKTTPEYLKDFNTVDSFDTHAKIPEYYKTLKAVSEKSGKLCAISIGWDPGLFSIVRGIFGAVLPDGADYTFWGKGVSQGHSDAIRRIDGVLDAVQFTVPVESAVNAVKQGKNPVLSASEKHLRQCYVAVKESADKSVIEKEIKEMPNYFAGYDTTVNFVSVEEVKSLRGKLPHGGFVLRSGKTSDGTNELLEFSLKLDSNPEFTGSVLTAYARAVAKMAKEGKSGVLTVYDIPLKYLSPLSEEDLRSKLL